MTPAMMRGPTRLPKLVLLCGILLTSLGVLAYFLLEKHSFYSTQDFLFSFLEYVWLPALFLGLLSTLFGAIAWARHMERKNSFGAAGAFFIIGLLAYAVPINVHGWTAAFLFVVPGAWIISLAFAVMAIFRKA